MPDWMTGKYKQAIFKAEHNKYQVISCYQASRASLQVIDISDAHVIITLVSAKQAYNARVELYNETESVCS